MPRKNHRSNRAKAKAATATDTCSASVDVPPHHITTPSQLHALDPTTLSLSQVTSVDEFLNTQLTQLNLTQRGSSQDKEKYMDLMVMKLDVMHLLGQFHALKQASTTTNPATIRHLTSEEMGAKIRGLMGENMQRVESGELKLPESVARLLNAAGGQALEDTKGDEDLGSMGAEDVDAVVGTGIQMEGKEEGEREDMMASFWKLPLHVKAEVWEIVCKDFKAGGKTA